MKLVQAEARFACANRVESGEEAGDPIKEAQFQWARLTPIIILAVNDFGLLGFELQFIARHFAFGSAHSRTEGAATHQPRGNALGQPFTHPRSSP
jgi:hypothetical protein